MITKTDILYVVAKLDPNASAAAIRRDLAVLEQRSEPRTLAEIVARLSRLEKSELLRSDRAGADSSYRAGTKLYHVTKEGQKLLVNLVKKADEIREIPSLAASLGAS